MAVVTTNMGLVAWDAPGDPYDHTQLAENFLLIDDHDHTPGKGHPLPEAGLKDRSVTEIKIALQAVGTPEIMDGAVTHQKLGANSVDGTNIVDRSITTDEIADGAVTQPKIDPNFLPVGTILMWGRPEALPGGGWEVCDGRPWSTIPNSMGYTSGAIPDLRNRVPLGAAVTGVGSAITTPPAIGQYGGSHTINIEHYHTVGPHTHIVPDHGHTILTDGGHYHSFPDDDGVPNDIFTRHVGVPTNEGTREALYVPGRHSVGTGGGSSKITRMMSAGNHDHGGSTSGAGQITTWSSGDGNTSAMVFSGTPTAIDVRNRYIGLLFIMKVR